MTGKGCRHCGRPLDPAQGRLCGYCAGLGRGGLNRRHSSADLQRRNARDADPEELDAAQDAYEALLGWGRDRP